jgi:hypothetical protein
MAADASLGGPPVENTIAQVASMDGVRQVQNERGAACVVTFTISAVALVPDGAEAP